MQLTDKDGNVFGTGGLEITTSTGKPKIPVINTDITIGTTTIVGGVAGRLLFDDAGVVGETNGVSWDKLNGRLGIGGTPTTTLYVNGSTTINDRYFYHQGASAIQYFMTSNAWSGTNSIFFGDDSSATIGSLSYNHQFDSFAINVNGGNRIQIPSTGNVLIGTTTDAGYKLDVNGTAVVRGITNVIGGTLRIASTGTLTQPSYITSHSDGGWNFTTYTHERGAGVHYFTSNNGSASIFSASAREGVNINVSSLTTGNPFSISGTVNASSAIARGQLINTTLVAAANNDVLVGLDVQPTFTNGAFTGVTNIAARIGGNVLLTQGPKTISIAAPSTSGSGGELTIAAGNATTAGTGGNISLQPGNGAGGPGAGTVIISNTSWWNGATVNGRLTVTNSGPNTGTSLQVNAGGQNGLSISWDNLTPFMQYGLVSARQSRFVNSSSYTFSSKVFINTNVDAGYNFDVNGTARIVNSLRLTTEITPSASAFSNGPLVSYITAVGWAAGRRPGMSFWGDAYSGAFLYFDGSLDFKAINDAGLSMTFASTAYVLANQPWTKNGSNISYSAGNVGIGTTSPIYNLEVVSSTGYVGMAIRSAQNNNAELSFQNAGYPTPRWTIRATAAADGSSGNLVFQRNASTFPMTITSGDNVLIGTSIDSGYKLDVNGTIRSIGTNGLILSDGTYAAKTWMNSYIYTIEKVGSYGISTYQLKYNDTTDALYLSSTSIRGDASYGVVMSRSIYAPHNGAFGFLTYGTTTQYSAIKALYTDNNSSGIAFNYKTANVDTEAMRITSTGNVGIGTTSPTSILDAVVSNGAKSGIRFRGYSDASTPYLLSLGTYTYSDIFQITSVNGLVSLNNTSLYDLALGTNNTERLRITSTGNVLIRTNVDSGYTLNVNGTGYFNGNVKVNGAIQASTPTASSYICHIVLTADQVLVSGADAVLDFVDFADANNWYDPTTKKFLPNVAGYYHVDFSLWFEPSPVSTGQYNIQVRKNGTTVMIAQQPTINNGTGQSLMSSKLVYFNGTTDYIDFTAYQSTGSNRNIWKGTDSSGTYATIHLLAV